MRENPNPNSLLLGNAIVGGAGFRLPPGIEVPEGKAAVLLFVPIEQMDGKNIVEIQADLGLPWYMEGGDPVWFDNSH